MSTTNSKEVISVKEKTNKSIRTAAEKNGVKLWQIADALGMNDGNFSRKLRHELPPEETEKILALIDELAKEVSQ